MQPADDSNQDHAAKPTAQFAVTEDTAQTVDGGQVPQSELTYGGS